MQITKPKKKRHRTTSVSMKEAFEAGGVRKPVYVELKIDNNAVPSPIIEFFQLDQTLGGHHQFIVELRRRQELEDKFGATMEDNARAWLSKTISFKVTAADSSSGDSGEVNFIGVVTAVDFESSVGSLGNVRILGYSPTIMLDLNQVCRTWLDVSSNDIMNSLISAEGMPNANVSASGGSNFSGFLAYKETPFQLINYLAGFEGWWAYYDGLHYNITKELPDVSIELKANQVGSFAVELDSSTIRNMKGRAFESIKGKWFQSKTKAPAPSSLALAKTAGGAQGITSSIEQLILAHEPDSQKSLDQRLDAAIRTSYAGLMRSRGSTDRLGLGPGKILKLKWAGIKKQTESRREEGFEGQYLITSVQHRYWDGRYLSEFRCVARDLAFPYYAGPELPEQILEVADVVNVDDPEKLGRVKVRFGWDSAAGETETPFIRLCQIQAGSTPHGAWIIPELSDSVLVSIRGHHLENATVLGSLYDGSRRPRADLHTPENYKKSIYTRSGNEITLNDELDKEQILITTKNGAGTILLDASSGAEKILIGANTDAARIVLDDSGGAQSITIESKNSSCKISLDGKNQSLTLEATKSIVLKANEITLEGTAAINVKSSAQIKQKAGATFDIEGGAMVNVKGGIIKLN